MLSNRLVRAGILLSGVSRCGVKMWKLILDLDAVPVNQYSTVQVYYPLLRGSRRRTSAEVKLVSAHTRKTHGRQSRKTRTQRRGLRPHLIHHHQAVVTNNTNTQNKRGGVARPRRGRWRGRGRPLPATPCGVCGAGRELPNAIIDPMTLLGQNFRRLIIKRTHIINTPTPRGIYFSIVES